MTYTHGGYGLSPAMPMDAFFAQWQLASMPSRASMQADAKPKTFTPNPVTLEAVKRRCTALHKSGYSISIPALRESPDLHHVSISNARRYLRYLESERFLTQLEKTGRFGCVLYKLARKNKKSNQ